MLQTQPQGGAGQERAPRPAQAKAGKRVLCTGPGLEPVLVHVGGLAVLPPGLVLLAQPGGGTDRRAVGTDQAPAVVHSPRGGQSGGRVHEGALALARPLGLLPLQVVRVTQVVTDPADAKAAVNGTLPGVDRMLRRNEDQGVAEERVECGSSDESCEQFEPVTADAGGVRAAGQQSQRNHGRVPHTC